ncbi:hypothetical protein CDAR_256881 [Caerostris darwini]|uniref:Transmembrane protein n=1 Tax=Caerostris darwini TaxID=1538125 RepID=A0AAV4PXH1_9ARAC|nr:hypothetical protein CDAR_256881 [Caerostris darwini]
MANPARAKARRVPRVSDRSAAISLNSCPAELHISRNSIVSVLFFLFVFLCLALLSFLSESAKLQTLLVGLPKWGLGVESPVARIRAAAFAVDAEIPADSALNRRCFTLRSPSPEQCDIAMPDIGCLLTELRNDVCSQNPRAQDDYSSGSFENGPHVLVLFNRKYIANAFQRGSKIHGRFEFLIRFEYKRVDFPSNCTFRLGFRWD